MKAEAIHISMMETVTFDGRTTTYAYDINGNRESVTYEGGVKEEYAYNRNNRLLTLTNKKPNGAIISKYSYTYDIIGNETSKTDNYGATYYTYDKAGRVTKVETPGKTTLYTYDNARNRQSLAETYTSNQSSGFVDGDTGEDIEYIIKTSRYFYSNTNKLLKLVEEMSDGNNKVLLEKTTEYLYDENGNELATSTSYLRPTGGTLKKSLRGSVHGENQPTTPDVLIERTNNTFDGFNRLKAVEKIEDVIRTSIYYTYNGDDLRTQKVVKSSDDSYTPQTASFLYDRQHVLLETDDTGNIQTRYVRGINYIAQYSSVDNSSDNGNGGGDNDNESNETVFSYFLFNGHGDTVQTVTQEGEIQNQYDYDIFGSPTLTIETAACSIRYAGEYLDNETGLYYLRARYYDPYTGRFISEDSYWGEDTNPLSLNLYTYAYNNPIRFIDPSGHSSKKIEVLIKTIDLNKEIWLAAQENTTITAAQRKEIQDSAHANANKLREELAELEKGNKDVETLVKQSGDDAGTWESYKRSVFQEETNEKVKTYQVKQKEQEMNLYDREIESSLGGGTQKTLAKMLDDKQENVYTHNSDLTPQKAKSIIPPVVTKSNTSQEKSSDDATGKGQSSGSSSNVNHSSIGNSYKITDTTVAKIADQLTWPVPSRPDPMTQNNYFSLTPTKARSNKYHTGTDIGEKEGVKVVAAYGGTVVRRNYNENVGYYIYIDSEVNGTWIQTRYRHLQEDSFKVDYGDEVIAGEHIADVGNTGKSSKSPHLHYEIWISTDGNKVNPDAWTASKENWYNAIPVDPQDIYPNNKVRADRWR
jgi:RHS repeat-associated protein